MREAYEASDDADRDPEMQAYRARYIAGEMSVERMEEAMEARLNELLHDDERRRRFGKAPALWVAADIARFNENRADARK